MRPRDGTDEGGGGESVEPTEHAERHEQEGDEESGKPAQHSELAFVLAERASRRERTFAGKCDESPKHFAEGMFDWQSYDVYRYIPGRWW